MFLIDHVEATCAQQVWFLLPHSIINTVHFLSILVIPIMVIFDA